MSCCGSSCKVWLDGSCFFFQAEDGIRDAQESRGLGDVYKRQLKDRSLTGSDVPQGAKLLAELFFFLLGIVRFVTPVSYTHLTLPTIYSV